MGNPDILGSWDSEYNYCDANDDLRFVRSRFEFTEHEPAGVFLGASLDTDDPYVELKLCWQDDVLEGAWISRLSPTGLVCFVGKVAFRAVGETRLQGIWTGTRAGDIVTPLATGEWAFNRLVTTQE